MVEATQVAVGPELAGQVADGQPPPPVGGKQVVAGEVDHVVLLAQHPDAAVEDQPDEPADAAILAADRRAPVQDAFQDRVVD